MACYNVHVKEATIVTPSEPTSCHSLLALSSLDSQLFLRFTVEYLLVYAPPHSGFDQGLTTARVKSALARALVPFYPLSGRVRTRPDSSYLEVNCRAQGALFIEAFSSRTVEEISEAPKFVTQWRKLLTLHVADVLNGAPPLVVQLTWLSDGAATLAVGFNHCVCDGIGSAEFLNFFAELARNGIADSEPNLVWDRHLLNPVHIPNRNFKSRSLLAHPEFNRAQDLCGFVNRFTHERLTPTSITFDKKGLTELKRLSRTGDSTHTSFESLSAHVWRSWARALDLPPNQILKLLFSINVRNRVKPNLPTGFYGNGFVLGCAQTTVKDLVRNGSGHAANLVKKAKERVDDVYVRTVIEAVSESRASPDSVGVLIVSDWSKMGLERVDFGMGRPVHVAPVCSDKYCLLLPVHGESEAIKVMVAIPATAVDKYEYLLRNPHL